MNFHTKRDFVLLQQPSGGFHPLTIAHTARVAQQGGTIDSPALLNLYVQYLVSNNLMSSQYIGAIPSVTGYKEGSVAGNCQIVFSVDPSGSTTGSYAGDMVQNTIVNQPKLLKYSGQKYYWSSNIAGNNCKTSFASKTISDFTIDTKVCIENYATQYGNFIFSFGDDNNLYFYYSNPYKIALNTSGGSVLSTVNVPFNAGDTYYIRVVKVGTNVKMYTSIDGISYTQLGTDLTLANSTINPFTTARVEDYGDAYGIFNTAGKIYHCRLISGGVNVINFDFTNYNPAISETTWTATTGETWTLNTSAGNSVNHSTIITRTSLVYNESSNMKSADFNTTANGGGITRFYIKKYQSGTVAQGGDHFRNAVAGSGTAAYYSYQSTILEGTDTIYCTDYIDTQTFTYGTAVIQNKSLILTSKKRYNIHDSLQVNKGTQSIPHILSSVPTTFNGDADSYALGTLAGVKQGHITFSGILPDLTVSAFQDFLNTTIFNGEIY